MATNQELLLKAMAQAGQSAAAAGNQQTAITQGAGDQKPNANTIADAMNKVSKTEQTQTPQEAGQEAVKKAQLHDSLSTNDLMNIRSDEDRQKIITAKQNWANATTDEGRSMAQEEAERVRAMYGYSGGSDGTKNIRLNSTDMQMSDEDKYELLRYKNQWEDANARGDEEGKKAANAAAQKLRAKYGYVSNPVTGEESTSLGLFTDPNTKTQYVATVTGDFVRTAPYPVQIVDENGKQITLTDAQGNELTPDMLVMGTDGRTYVASNGQRMIDLAEQYGINDSNVRFLVNGNYYTVTGMNVTDQMGPLKVKEWTDNDTYNELYQALAKLGLERTPFINDYDTLSWDQALARATQQLNGRYDKALNDSLDTINRAALKTGFFGQLPTEALKAQAAASTELERQGAINELASTLMNDSRSESQRLYEDDTKSIQEQIEVIMQLYNYLYRLNQDIIDQGEDATRLDQSQQQIDITKEQNVLSREELLLKAAQIMDELRSEGFDAPQVSAWLSAQE